MDEQFAELMDETYDVITHVGDEVFTERRNDFVATLRRELRARIINSIFNMEDSSNISYRELEEISLNI